MIFDRVQRPLDHPVVVKKKRKSREKRRDRMFNLWKNGGGKSIFDKYVFSLVCRCFHDDSPPFPTKTNSQIQGMTHKWVSARHGDLSEWGPYSGL